jgi:hypothetical protein
MICFEFCDAGNTGEFRLSDIGSTFQNVQYFAAVSQNDTPQQRNAIYLVPVKTARKILQSVKKYPWFLSCLKLAGPQ